MLRFDSADPFPLVVPEPAYADAKAHAEQADRWLGLDTAGVEAGLRPVEGQRLWVGLPVQTMLTPYTELRAMLARVAPAPGQTVVDLGAGYGRMGFVIARHFRHVRFTGYEFAGARVEHGAAALRRFVGGPGPTLSPPEDITLAEADLASPEFAPEEADFYFIYDYGTREAIEKTLQDLRGIAARRPITVIGRGRATRDAIERSHPWLSKVNAAEHCGNFSIYRS